MPINREAEAAVTADMVRRLLRYDPDTGQFWRIAVQSSGRLSLLEKPAGSRRPTGRMFVKIGRRAFAASRLAWLYMTGEWPKVEIDHKDLDGTNDRWNNLREATPSQNIQNRRVRPGSMTGEKCIKRVRTRWVVRTTENGVRKSRYFPTIEAARQARDQILVSTYGEFARAE